MAKTAARASGGGGVGRTIGRPYAPTAGATSDDDDSLFASRAVKIERAMPP